MITQPARHYPGGSLTEAEITMQVTAESSQTVPSWYVLELIESLAGERRANQVRRHQTP